MTTETARQIDALGQKAADIAANSAVEYLRSVGATASVNVNRLSAELKSRAKVAALQALDDAKQALESGMAHYAEATFAATMRVAGIEAAKAAIA